MKLEFERADTPSDIIAALDRYGAALIRGAVPKETVQRYRDGLDRLYRLHREGEVTDIPENERRALDRGDVWPNALGKYIGLSFSAYFAAPFLRTIVDRVLVSAVPNNQTILTVEASPKALNNGIAMHTDGIVLGTAEASISLWSPLHPCGVDAPGLSLIPASRQAVTDYLRAKFPGKELPGWSSMTEWNSTGAFDEASLSAAFAPAWSPALEAGDVIVFTNWTLHGSQVRPEMKAKRSAIVQRWCSPSWRLAGPVRRATWRLRDHLQA